MEALQFGLNPLVFGAWFSPLRLNQETKCWVLIPWFSGLGFHLNKYRLTVYKESLNPLVFGAWFSPLNQCR